MKLNLKKLGINKTVEAKITNRVARNALQVAKMATASDATDDDDLALDDQIGMIEAIVSFIDDVFKLTDKQVDQIWDCDFSTTQEFFGELSNAIFEAKTLSPTEAGAKK
ncbi:phage tail tube assembly chaperone [Lactiplantibacillus plantarum]|uniref:phage tail tube assembly chaperone n=1 Tax=Lactiplantibacillus plantarum TaxID=1590 RepID=UPI00108040B3|nr:phage tail tube assembly chaperone [Lactiplantibacillus plantarum]QBX93959.1 hypothetical protein DVH03_06180 [Lactiplantibacillus plantarum]